MSISKIVFANGHELEITNFEFDRMPPKLQRLGIRTYKTAYGVLVPMNSHTIAYIERGEDEVSQRESDEREVVEPVAVPDTDTGSDNGETVEEDTKPEPEKSETKQERNDRLLAVMKEKSDCAGNKHKGQEQIIYFQDIMITKKGAKKSLPSRRYFPVCSFCGLRQKYVKADSLTDEQKDNAKLWQES